NENRPADRVLLPRLPFTKVPRVPALFPTDEECIFTEVKKGGHVANAGREPADRSGWQVTLLGSATRDGDGKQAQAGRQAHGISPRGMLPDRRLTRYGITGLLFWRCRGPSGTPPRTSPRPPGCR